jgi:hypothetical protein
MRSPAEAANAARLAQFGAAALLARAMAAICGAQASWLNCWSGSHKGVRGTSTPVEHAVMQQHKE